VTEAYRFTAGTVPLLISVPHCGTVLPDAIAARLTADARMLHDTDWHVDRLYDFAASLGIGMIAATHSRLVVDLNRDPTGTPLYPGADNTEICPLRGFNGQPLYAPGAEPDAAEVAARIESVWRPYHARLAAELDALKARHGVAVLWDAHSIASRVPRFFEGRLPDLNLGTNSGRSAAPEIVAAAEAALSDASGFTFVRDGRFKGGFITRHFGCPAEGLHALQLEMAQIAYMEEQPPYAYDVGKAERIRPALRAALAAILARLR